MTEMVGEKGYNMVSGYSLIVFLLCFIFVLSYLFHSLFCYYPCTCLVFFLCFMFVSQSFFTQFCKFFFLLLKCFSYYVVNFFMLNIFTLMKLYFYLCSIIHSFFWCYFNYLACHLHIVQLSISFGVFFRLSNFYRCGRCVAPGSLMSDLRTNSCWYGSCITPRPSWTWQVC